jgi:hypothetical protein
MRSIARRATIGLLSTSTAFFAADSGFSRTGGVRWVRCKCKGGAGCASEMVWQGSRVLWSAHKPNQTRPRRGQRATTDSLAGTDAGKAPRQIAVGPSALFFLSDVSKHSQCSRTAQSPAPHHGRCCCEGAVLRRYSLRTYSAYSAHAHSIGVCTSPGHTPSRGVWCSPGFMCGFSTHASTHLLCVWRCRELSMLRTCTY